MDEFELTIYHDFDAFLEDWLDLALPPAIHCDVTGDMFEGQTLDPI